MPEHIELGKLGENLACDFLQRQNYTILFRNWRYSNAEIDIIASHEKVLHFIEVKTRSTKNYGEPEDSVNSKKMKKLIDAAEAFQEEQPEWTRIQFDILSITMEKGNAVEYFLLEDVYL
jgi:putative endonuclease